VKRFGERSREQEFVLYELHGRTTTGLPGIEVVVLLGLRLIGGAEKKSLCCPGLLARRRWSSTKGGNKSSASHELDTLRKRPMDLAGR
jgi:hypothetical protein